MLNSKYPHQRKLLRLMQLNSPSLPIGAYAYSQGLEFALSKSLIGEKFKAQDWLETMLFNALVPNDLALIVRSYKAWHLEDYSTIHLLISQSHALRETSELLQEDLHLSQALARLAEPLGVALPDGYPKKSTYPVIYSRFAQAWQISLEDSLTAFAWSWLENQIACLLKLCSIGQTQAQQLMMAMDESVINAVAKSIELPDELLGRSLPNLAIISSKHENQYSRLFRS